MCHVGGPLTMGLQYYWSPVVIDHNKNAASFAKFFSLIFLCKSHNKRFRILNTNKAPAKKKKKTKSSKSNNAPNKLQRNLTPYCRPIARSHIQKPATKKKIQVDIHFPWAGSPLRTKVLSNLDPAP